MNLLFSELPALYIILKLIMLLTNLICYFSALVRRLHDIGYYGIDLLLILVPIYNLYFFALLFFKKGNRYL